MSFIEWLISALITGAGTILNQWIQAENYGETQRQIGALEYENTAKQAELEQAKAAATTAQLIRSLSDEQLLERMRQTNATIDSYRNPVSVQLDTSSKGA